MTRSLRLVTLRRLGLSALIVLSVALLPPTVGIAAYTAGSPDPVIVSDAAPGPVTWTSDAMQGTNVNNTNGDNCFDASTNKPVDPKVLVGPNACEVLTLTVNDTAAFWTNHTGGVTFHSVEGANDYDFYVYRKNGDGTKGAFITAQGAIGGTGGVEDFTIDKPVGDYYVAAVAFAT